MTHIYLIAPLIFFFACRTTHLGPATNVAYRAAFDAQRASTPEKTPTFGADDARAINATRRGDRGKAGGSTAPAPGSISLPSPSGSMGGGGAWQGAQGSMSLEAK